MESLRIAAAVFASLLSLAPIGLCAQAGAANSANTPQHGKASQIPTSRGNG